MPEKVHKIPFYPLHLRIEFLTQNLVDLLNGPFPIHQFPNPCRDRVLQSIEPSNFRPGLFDGYKENYPIDHPPGEQRILFKALVD